MQIQLLLVEPVLDTMVQMMEGIQQFLGSHDKYFRARSSGRDHLEEFQAVLTTCGRQIIAMKRNLQAILTRCAATARLLEQVASSRNEKTAQQQNLRLTELTRLTVDDSNAIRVITVITLLYLSLTAVAVSIIVLFCTSYSM